MRVRLNVCPLSLLNCAYPSTSNPFVDIEAVESGESEAEENLDQYESDFIDDRDLVADDAE